jgi:predicted DsbA family dithiol-disulfide isomerase
MALKPLQIDIVSDVVCPWCYIGKKRIEDALALASDVPVHVNWRPFFLNPWVPREGITRDEYLTKNSARPKPTRTSRAVSLRRRRKRGCNTIPAA